ncbi:hypothetical protein [Gottfriedia solisilvae]|uniref:hypothetical protein n=1 Tax=Gottfriedia solisilvae TaxID=1516104 RepID=UPI003D2EA3C0
MIILLLAKSLVIAVVLCWLRIFIDEILRQWEYEDEEKRKVFIIGVPGLTILYFSYEIFIK